MKRLTCTLSIAAAALLSTHALAAPHFRATHLGDLAGGEDYSRVFGLNNHGELVGESGASLDYWTGRRGFLWSAGAMHEVGKSTYALEKLDWTNESGEILAPSFQWHATHFGSSARAIDDTGRVYLEVGPRFAPVVEDGERYLGEVIRTETRYSDVAGINSRVVQPAMYTNTASGNAHVGGTALSGRAAVWAPEGSVTELVNGTGSGFTLSSDHSGAVFGVNDHGVAVGVSKGLPVLWRADGTLEELPVFPEATNSVGCPTMPGAYTLCVTWTGAGVPRGGAATGVSNLGHIVGYTVAGGFLLKDGAVTQLASGVQTFKPSALNDAGDIVGTLSTGRAAVRTSGGSFLDLTNVTEGLDGWQLTDAVAINAHGQIAANGTRNGITHAFLLTPVPEPAIVWLMVSGLVAVGIRVQGGGAHHRRVGRMA